MPMKKTVIPIVIGTVITIVFAALAIIRFLPLERLELLLYDLRYQIHGKSEPAKDVVIVAIDDRSLEKLGRWPWDRSRIAAVIDILREQGARVIMMDMIFSEAAKDDAILAEAIRKAGNVIVPVVFEFKEDAVKVVPNEAVYNSAIPNLQNTENIEIFPPIHATGLLEPVQKISAAAKTIGHINMIADRDGVLRWEVMAVEYNGEFYPSVNLQAVRLFLDIPMEHLVLKMAEGIQMGDHFIPTDFWNRTLIHYYGPDRTFPHISILDVLEHRVSPDAVKDRIILIGATAIGIYDLRVTPAAPALPGVEKHANVISSILQQEFIYKTKNITNVMLIFLSGFLFSLLMTKARAVLGALLGILFISIILYSGYLVFFRYGLWMDVSYSALNILVIYFAINAYRYATEERYAKQIRSMFSSYVTERVVNELIKNPSLAKLGGERKEVTVLFSDVRGFTTFSEQHTPEEVVSQLNEYLSAMSDVIFKWEGTLDKYIGDAIVAFWNAPLPQENHAELAVRCALNMVQRLGELQRKWQAEGKTILSSGIGINTGDVVVGNIGSEGRKMDYTVIGDHVNLGARVESLTKKYSTHLLITEFALDKIRKLIETDKFYRLSVKGLEKVIVKGKDKPVAVYEVKSMDPGFQSAIIDVESEEIKRLEEK